MIEQNKCSCCRKEKHLKYCFDCYNSMFFGYLSEKMAGDLVTRIKFELGNELNDKLEEIRDELRDFKTRVKLKKGKMVKE